MLFDLANDPKELRDLGADGAHAHIRREMEERMAAWLKARKTRVTVDDAYVEARTASSQEARHPSSACGGHGRLTSGLVQRIIAETRRSAALIFSRRRAEGRALAQP